MIRHIHLHGGLGRRFGKRFDLAVETPAEAIRALTHMLRGFREALSQGAYRVVRGRMGLPVEGLHLRFGQCNELHIIPAPLGAKNSGTSKIVIGVVLIAAAVLTYGAALGWFGTAAPGVLAAQAAGTSVVAPAMAASAVGVSGVLTVTQLGFMGIGMVLAGVSMLLSPQPKAQGPMIVDQNPSFMFNGPVNASAQGGPVPLVYGKVRVGSIVGATSLKAEDYVVNTEAAKFDIKNWMLTTLQDQRQSGA